jgi:pyruvate,orthophosphate dikinase
MFLGERRQLVEDLVLAENDEQRQAALDALAPLQKGDFIGILEAMDGLPVTIRLIDPPLHEFLPDLTDLSVKIALAGDDADPKDRKLLDAVHRLHEQNPMLGLRGVRLGIVKPGLYAMQVRAIVRAALSVEERTGNAPLVEIMHPLVGFREELRRLRELTLDTASAEMEQAEREIDYLIGTMIELPRACLRADDLAPEADFFSFGTNDLTQTTLGFSRDDAEAGFLAHYLDEGVLDENPFETLDRGGVGDLMTLATERARGVKNDLKLGICGEHGGDARSVTFCHDLGLDYISCSPYRVPLARLAAAQAALAEAGVKTAAVGG